MSGDPLVAIPAEVDATFAGAVSPFSDLAAAVGTASSDRVVSTSA